eukprot:scaffold19202_cov121-Isochrysis_galbana.AAC.3
MKHEGWHGPMAMGHTLVGATATAQSAGGADSSGDGPGTGEAAAGTPPQTTTQAAHGAPGYPGPAVLFALALACLEV